MASGEKPFTVLVLLVWRHDTTGQLLTQQCITNPTIVYPGWRPRICKNFDFTRTICSNVEMFDKRMLFYLVPGGFSDKSGQL